MYNYIIINLHNYADILQKVDSSVQNAKVSIFHNKSAENTSLRYWEKICVYSVYQKKLNLSNSN
jgi:hypothetical protein